jgi:predicted metallopeptidase
MSLQAAVTWNADAIFTITLFINPYYLCVCLSSYGDSMSHKSNVLIALHFHLILASFSISLRTVFT